MNLNHDSSAAIVGADGTPIAAMGEERITRIKNQFGIPRHAVNFITKLYPDLEYSEIIVGSHSVIKTDPVSLSNFQRGGDIYWRYLLSVDEKNHIDIVNSPLPPGWLRENQGQLADVSLIDESNFFNLVKEIVADSENMSKTTISGTNHHDGHQMSAFIASNFKQALVISLDGEGDHESGAVSIMQRSSQGVVQSRQLARIPSTDSLGALYSNVTKRYGFTASKHEGKITGLAAYGRNSHALEVLSNFVEVANGVPKIDFEGKHSSKQGQIKYSFRDAVDSLSWKGQFPDLAFGIQELLEKVVLEIIEYWVDYTGISNIAIAGGVFANVRVNQRIAELSSVNGIYIYPNMGDGGLAIGGVWARMAAKGIPITTEQGGSVFLGPTAYSQNELDGIRQQPLQLESGLQIAQIISEGKIVGVILGDMEWGPRALGHRSLLADPRDSNINVTLNKRLRRTEFMPFAPVVQEEMLRTVFDTDQIDDLRNFENMTMTVQVRDKYRSLLGAVTHVDGSARPQTVNKMSNPLYHSIIGSFFKLTGSPCIVNTSFNAHEEPIVWNMKDALKALKGGVCDFVTDGEHLYFLEPES
jgi:carbamoyltransferase